MLYSQLLELDAIIFQLINQGLSNPVFDALLPLFRIKHFWIPVYTYIIAYLFFNFRTTGWKLLILIFIGVGITDTVSSQVIKKSVKRVRPCDKMEIVVIERVNCGSGYSFTSSHAANHFVISILLILGLIKRKWLKWLVVFWALIICLAQVYVGVHYPSDVFAGAILGILTGYLIYTLGKKAGWTIELSTQQ